MADVENNIFRAPTASDKQYFDVDLNKPKRRKTSHEKFEAELGIKELEATKKGLPFAKVVARDDFQRAIQSQIDEQMKEYGNVEFPEKLKLPEMDWDKYSDLKNFELIDEGSTYDPNSTKNNPGLRVSMKKKTYKFKGYGNKYTVMEDEPSAIHRAQEKSWKAEKAAKI